MSVTQVGPTDDPTKPIAANTLNSTKATGIGAFIIAVGAGLGTALETFAERPAAVQIAVLATIAVAIVIAGYVAVADMRVRSRQTVADNCLRYLRDRAVPTSPSPTRVIATITSDGVKLFEVEGEIDEGRQVPALTGNGAERSG